MSQTNYFSIFVQHLFIMKNNAVSITANSIQYAIVDIETTGGYASGSGITEIAILIHDGHEVVERFESLVNPQAPIPLYIQALTGIDEQMVESAPTFNELAQRIFDLLAGRIFVAHHVNFDYSFIKHHLEQAGYIFSAPRLCTVRMSRKIRPGLSSYSLGRLCDTLGIAIVNRHRAGGDAQATAVLFTKLLEWDTQGVYTEMLRKTSRHQQLPPNLPKEQFDGLPGGPGVYYFRDSHGKVIYVGKANNIRNRVASHFSGHNPNPQRQYFLRHIHSITHERCGTELMALLLEAAEIKRLWPAYNRALKRFEPKFALYSYEDQQGYIRLAIGKYGKYHSCVRVFHRQTDAANLLRMLIKDFDLDQQFCSFGGQAKPMIPSNTGLCRPPEDHNTRLRAALQTLTGNAANFIIADRGRDEQEMSCIWVENGSLYGMGYLRIDGDGPADAEGLKASLTRYTSTHYMMQLIGSYAEKHPEKVCPIERLSTFSFFNTALP